MDVADALMQGIELIEAIRGSCVCCMWPCGVMLRSTACIVHVHVIVLSEQVQVPFCGSCIWELRHMVVALVSSSPMTVLHGSSSGSSLLHVLLGCCQHQQLLLPLPLHHRSCTGLLMLLTGWLTAAAAAGGLSGLGRPHSVGLATSSGSALRNA